MKKIIATVLAMVMALALCTTAFAADKTYTGYNTKGQKDGYTYDVDTKHTGDYDKTTGEGTITWYELSRTNGTATETKLAVAATSSDYDVKLTATSKSTLYFTFVESGGASYECKATAYTNIGEKCGQIDVDKDTKVYTNTGKYNSSSETVFFVESDAADSFNILVDGALVSVETITPVAHDWVGATFDKDGDATTYKCDNCKTVATVYKTVEAAKAAGNKVVSTDEIAGVILGYTNGTDNTKTDDNKGTSPKTFDAGIAMYVGMALTSVAGSAVVIGKKKEF